MKATVDTDTRSSVVWKFINDGIDMDPTEFKESYTQLKDEIKYNQVDNWGDFLHIAGVMLHYSRLRVVPDTEEEILSMLHQKILENAARGNFEPLPNSVFITGGWRGWGIFEFARLKEAGIIDLIMKEQNAKSIQAIKEEFLEFIKNIDEEDKLLELCEHIKLVPGGGKFARQPVFSCLDEKEKESFFKTVIAHEMRNIHRFVLSLQQRYNVGVINAGVEDYLMPEEGFIESFNEYAEKKLNEEKREYNPGIEKYQYIMDLLVPIRTEFKSR